MKAALLAVLSDKMNRLEQNLLDLRHSAANETKSSAGDKYETARAMLHAEQENIRNQLQKVQAQRAEANRIDEGISPAVAGFGSIVETNSGTFFISTSAGKLTVDHEEIMSISGDAPLAQKLKGLRTSEVAEVNSRLYTITAVY